MKEALKTYLTPPLALIIICLIVTLALTLTHGVTKDKIEAATEKTKSDAIEAVLSDGDGKAFEEKVKSFGGELTVMVGIGSDGKVSGVSIISHSDTPGLGTQPMEPEYLEQYIGLSALTTADIRDSEQVDTVTGATISSDAIYTAVRNALKEFGGASK